jgi:rhamnogalacturonan endolyase
MKKLTLPLIAGIFISMSLAAQLPIGEKIDRGVVALTMAENRVYVGWRLLLNDPPDVSFNIYRCDVGFSKYEKVNESPVIKTTDFIDRTVKPGRGYRYKIKRLLNGNEENSPGEAYVFTLSEKKPYISIKLADDIKAKRIAVGDLNGDGAYDFVIQNPDFNVDPYHEAGYWKRSPETYKLDAYSSTGKFLWRYDMGWAIETGTWYSPYQVYDVDGDGKAEVYAKAGEGDPRETDGHVLDGKEYLVKINGQTGKIELKKEWLSKDGFDSYNYWSRNFLKVAYLNGKSPALIQQRGTYTIIKTLALDKNMQKIWYWESTGQYANYKGQGQHGILSADIDSDGKDELIIGTAALDDNGIPLWRTGLGHNDAGYIADIDPSRPGMEIFYGIESRSPKNGVCLVDARTGEIIWGFEGKTVHVHSQGMVGDIDPKYPGMECYAGEAKGGSQYFLYSAKGERLSDKDIGSLTPRPVWWDEDEFKEVSINENLMKFKGDTLLKIEGKVMMIADLLGDWREEIVTSLPGEMRIYSTNIPAKNRKVCLMQNRQYRLGVADASMGYFYPPQLGIEK